MKTSKYLAEAAMKRAKGCKLTKGENTETSTGALISAYADSLTNWQGIEGVRIDRTPKPVPVGEPADNPTVKKMFVMSDLINEECHLFNNLIILN